jgi:hypothetical protein
MIEYWSVWGFLTLPITLSVLVAIVMWRKLTRRLLFVVTAILALTGLQSFIAPVAVTAFFPMSADASRELQSDAFTRAALASAVVVLVVGGPFLFWLQRVFRATKDNQAG